MTIGCDCYYKKMDVLRNIKSMTASQFCSLQIFELIYLIVLAFLPFVVALREIAYAVLGIVAVVVVAALFRRFSLQKIDAKGRVVLITGCDSGFGNACARRLDSLGFTVVAGCYDDSGEGAAELKKASSGNLYIIKLDITDEENVRQLMLRVKSLCGGKGLWALINNAGVSGFGNIEFVSLDTYQSVMNVNLLGTLRVTKACLPFIRAAKGRVVMISGSAGQLSLPGQSAFCISNFGLEAFSDALRLEMQPFGVKVITIRPGNYAGATGMLNKSGLEKLNSHFDEMKQNTDGEVRAAYGQSFLDNQYSQLVAMSKSAASSLISVVDEMEKAVRSQRPKSQVLVDGGNQLLDIGNVLIHIRPFVPSVLLDFLVSKLYQTNNSSTVTKS